MASYERMVHENRTMAEKTWRLAPLVLAVVVLCVIAAALLTPLIHALQNDAARLNDPDGVAFREMFLFASTRAPARSRAKP